MRTGKLAVISIIAAAAGGLLALIAARSVAAQSPHWTLALWNVTVNSSHRGSQSEQVCFNARTSGAEIPTCAGPVRTPNTFTDQTVSCKSRVAKTSTFEMTTSVATSDDQNTIRVRTDQKFDLPIGSQWSEAVMTYQGACPVTLKPGQPFVIVKPDGKVIDPFENTPCMVDVLRTVDGVTAPSIGFFQDPDFGPSPFVRYNYPGPDGRSAEVTFVAQGDLADPGKWAFVAQMSGLHGPGGPYVYGADKFMTPWHDRCHVETRILFP